METVDNNDDDDAEDDAQEVEELERQPLVGAKTGKATDLTDVGLWPVKVGREIRAMLVRQGSAAVQHLDHEFMEIARSGTKTKGNARKLTKKTGSIGIWGLGSSFLGWFWESWRTMGSRLVTALARHMTLLLLWQATDRVCRSASPKST